MMTLHDLHDVDAEAEAEIRAMCRARVCRLVADEMQALDEAAIDALFNELSVWIRREGRAHRRTARLSGGLPAGRSLPGCSDAASPDQEHQPTYQLRPERRFQAMPSQGDIATPRGPSQQDDPADQGTASGSRLFDALRRLRIRAEGRRAPDENREAALPRAAAGNREAHPPLPHGEAQSIEWSGPERPGHSDQSSSVVSYDNRFRFKRLDRTEIGALAHRICEGAKKSMPADNAGDDA